MNGQQITEALQAKLRDRMEFGSACGDRYRVTSALIRDDGTGEIEIKGAGTTRYRFRLDGTPARKNQAARVNRLIAELLR